MFRSSFPPAARARAALGALAISIASATASASTGGTFRVSVDSAGVPGNARSGAVLDRLLLSADGRFVVFDSDATNLVVGDGNARSDVFVRDRQAATTLRVSVDASGGEANGASYEPAISVDDRWVVFRSAASNLVPGDTNGFDDVFAKDRTSGAIVRVSTSTSGAEANEASFLPSVSSGGRYVVYESFASNLVAGDTNNTRDVFLVDRDADGDAIYDEPGAIATVRISISASNVQGDDESRHPSMTPNARFVVFESDATNLVAGDTNGTTDVFVRDRVAGTTLRMSVSAFGAQGNGASVDPVISGTGRFVVFTSDATNLATGDTNAVRDVFVRDRDADGDGIFDEFGATTVVRASVDDSGAQANGSSDDAQISGDGRWVTFRSVASNLVPGDSNGRSDVFLRDLAAGRTVRISLDSSGAEGNGNSFDPSVSTDGRFVAFSSLATNLVAGDANAVSDVFVVDRLDSTPPLLSCPQALAAECASAGGSTLSYLVTATDACDPSPLISCAPASGSLFAVGTTAVSCSATDRTGNVSTCAFDVVVSDSVAPSMSCPVRVDVSCAGPSGALASYTVTATDTCDASPSVFCTPPSGSIFPVGNTMVACSTSDASGNAAACSFAVIVHDAIAPSLSCPTLVFVECTDPAGTTASFAVTATDACDLAPRVACLPPSGSAFPTGHTTIACSATDASGNVGTCGFDVVIADTTPPAIHCPDDVSTAAEPGGGANVSFQVTAPDACDSSPRVACVPPSGSLFPTGTTSVACTAIDAANNLASCSFHVIVGNVAVTAILPSRGSEAGGDAVLLQGFGFTTLADVSVTFGGAAAVVLDVTAGTVRVQTPPGLGAADVVLSDSLGGVRVPAGFVFVDPAIAARFGNVNVGRGDREDVLTTNGGVGDASRELWIPVGTPVEADMTTPSSRTSAAFALYAWFGAPNSSTLKTQPFGIGAMVFPTPLTRACLPQPRRTWNNAGHRPRLGEPDFPSSPAPSVVFRRNHGFRRPVVATLQGFIRDSGSQNLGGFSITNAIVLHVTP